MLWFLLCFIDFHGRIQSNKYTIVQIPPPAFFKGGEEGLSKKMAKGGEGGSLKKGGGC